MDVTVNTNLIGKSPAFLRVRDLICKFAACDATVLIEGETGTGKELAARAIHYFSKRRDYAFIPVNCGALPDNLVESELFGHIKGAFTDAKTTKVGLVGQACGGSIFFDEVEAMSLHAQVALLRFLQDKEYRPVGSTVPRESDVRIVASSNADLRAMVQHGSFREDLLFRLNVLPVQLPALRDRPGDIALIVQTFLDRLNRQSDLPAKTCHPDTLTAFEQYSWPGNVRELENLVQREFLLASDDVIRISCVDANGGIPFPEVTQESFSSAKERAIAQFEKAYITALLAKTEGNVSMASRLAGKDRSDIGKLMKKYGVGRVQFSQHRAN